VAIACGVFALPTYKGHRFAAKINSGDFSELYSLKYPDRIWQFTRNLGRYSLEELRIEAVLHPMSWRDAIQFRRRVSIDVWPPRDADQRLPRQDSSPAFIHITGTKLGGERWE
jgi:hypothetical protein